MDKRGHHLEFGFFFFLFLFFFFFLIVFFLFLFSLFPFLFSFFFSFFSFVFSPPLLSFLFSFSFHFFLYSLTSSLFSFPPEGKDLMSNSNNNNKAFLLVPTGSDNLEYDALRQTDLRNLNVISFLFVLGTKGRMQPVVMAPFSAT